MDASIVEAFKKLEAKIKDDKEKVQREERVAQLRAKHEAAEKERKKHECLIYAASLSFLLAVLFLIYYANEAQIQASGGVGAWMSSKVEQIAVVSSISKNKDEVDCAQPDNWKLPVCIEAKKDEVSNKWQNMALNKGGKEKPFTISAPK